MSVADKVIKGVEDGHISRIFFIGGCDGAETERNYFKDLALATPENSIILTAGCGKYRFNKFNVRFFFPIPPHSKPDGCVLAPLALSPIFDACASFVC